MDTSGRGKDLSTDLALYYCTMSTPGVARPLIHLDLKGAPPSEDFLLGSWLPWVAAAGAGGILVEYEDAISFKESPKLSRLSSSPGAWDRRRLDRFLRAAESLDLEVVPLVQTLGHAEYLLKQAHLEELRELADLPECFKVSDYLKGEGQSPVLTFLTDLLTEVLSLHPKCKAIHVGGDEVWHLAKGPESQAALAADSGLTPTKLYLGHMEAVSGIVWSSRPEVQVLMWDDMLRNVSAEELAGASPFLRKIVPVVWQYTADLSFPRGMWERYGEVFSDVLVAGAFKGASSSRGQVVPVLQHTQNAAAWLRLSRAFKDIQENGESCPKRTPRIGGFVLTGWQRFDHFAVLCELLPVSSPSLLCCLKVLKSGGSSSVDWVLSEVSKELTLDESLWEREGRPEKFPGAALYFEMPRWLAFRGRAEALLGGDYAGTWCSRWNLEGGRGASRLHLGEIGAASDRLLEEGRALEKKMEELLGRYFGREAVEEWVSCFAEDVLGKLSELSEKCQTGASAVHRAK